MARLNEAQKSKVIEYVTDINKAATIHEVKFEYSMVSVKITNKWYDAEWVDLGEPEDVLDRAEHYFEDKEGFLSGESNYG